MARSKPAPQAIPLTEAEIRPLSQVIRDKINYTTSLRTARIMKAILEKLDHAAVTSP